MRLNQPFNAKIDVTEKLVTGAHVLRFFRFILVIQQGNQKCQREKQKIAFFYYSYPAVLNLTEKKTYWWRRDTCDDWLLPGYEFSRANTNQSQRLHGSL